MARSVDGSAKDRASTWVAGKLISLVSDNLPETILPGQSGFLT